MLSLEMRASFGADNRIHFSLAWPCGSLMWTSGSARGSKASRVGAYGILVSLKCLVGLTDTEQGHHNIPDEPCLIIARSPVNVGGAGVPNSASRRGD